MKSAISIRTLIGITALLFSILTCYGRDDPSDMLVGIWTKTFSERTVTFTLTSDKKFQVEFVADEEIDVWGSYVISGTQITFNDEGGEYGSDEAGVYKFQVSDTSVKFTQVDDPVFGRSLLMEGSWSRASDVK